MKNRLILAFIMVSMVAIVLSGLGGYTLIKRSQAKATRQTALSDATQLVSEVKAVEKSLVGTICKIQPTSTVCSKRILNFLRLAGKVDNATIILLTQGGQISQGALPPGVTIQDINTSYLLSGESTSGTKGYLAYGAVPIGNFSLRRNASNYFTAVVVLTRAAPTEPGFGPYFLLSSLLSLLFATLVAIWLATRISRPLIKAARTTKQIAQGDLSARVPIEEHEYAELAELSSAINAMAESLEGARNLERQFFMSVSHDLRTPLTSIKGYAEAIIDGTADVPKNAAEIIASESRRLQRLVQDLLDLAKLDARHFKLNNNLVSIAEITTSVVDSFRPMFDEAGLKLGADTDSSLSSTVKGDSDRIAQIISNLVDNAYKYAKSKVDVKVSTSEDNIEISVKDDGPGIDSADLPHVFDRLFTSNRHVSRIAGSGLGLAIVSELSRAMGASAYARSPQNGEIGTEMVIRFPSR